MPKLHSMIMMPLILIFLAWPSHVMAQGKVQASLNLTEGTMDDDFILTITISGKAKDFEMPLVPGVKFRQAQQASRTSIQIGGGNTGTKVETDYGFFLTIDNPGTYTIPSLTINIDGQPEKTLPLTFTVKPAGTVTRDTAGEDGTDIFIERSLSQKKAFVGEDVVVTNRIFTRQTMHQPKIELPEGSGFKFFSVKGERQYSKVLNGQTYQVIEFDNIVVPQSSGTLTLSPLRLEAFIPNREPSQQRRPRSPFGGMFDDDMFNGMFSMGRNLKQIRVSSPNLSLQVEDIPTAKQPADFTGLVGQFSLKSKVSADDVNTGDSVTVEVILSGTGYSEGVESLKPEFDRSLKIYPDQPQQTQTPTSNGFRTEQIFKFAVVPTTAGKIKAGTASLSYFDPKARSFKSLTTDLGVITVSGASIAPPDPATAGENKSNIAAVGRDLLPLRETSRLIEPSAFSKFNRIILVLLALAPWFFALIFGLKKWSGSLDLRKRFTKAQSPLSKLNAELTQAQDLIRGDNTSQGLQLSDKALRQYIDMHADERRRLVLESAKNEIEATLYSGRKLNSEEAIAMVQKAKDLVKAAEAKS